MKRTPLAALALLVGVACAGCSDDPRPDFAPPESTSPAPTDPTTTATTPVTLSPEETVRAWVEARNLGLDSGRLSKVRSLSAPDCVSCDDLIDPIEQVYEAGGEFRTNGWSIAGSNVKTEKDRSARIQVALDIAGGQTIEQSGGDPVAYPPEKRIAIFELAKLEGRWAVSLIGFLS